MSNAGTNPGAPSVSASPNAQLRTFGLLVLAIGVLSGAATGLARGLRLLNWQSWSHTQARYVGGRSVSSGRSGGGGSCERSYEITVTGTPVTRSVDAPCLVLLGPNPDPGATVDVAYEAPEGAKVLSETEVFAVGAFELVPAVCLSLGVALVFASRKRHAPPARA